MKEKLKLNRVILGGLLLGSLSTFSVPLVRTEQVCPIGGERFEDLDVPQCPTNKFVMFKKKFTAEELEKYEKIISSKEYREIPGNSNKYYYLAKFYELLGEVSDKTLGKTYFDSYHYYSENEKTKMESLQQGISYLEKAVKRDNEIMWDLAKLYSEAEEYIKMNKLLEKTGRRDFGINEDRKKGKGIEEVQLLRQAKLYRELGKRDEIDALFAKADKKFGKAISLFYIDEPETSLGKVYNKDKISSERELKQALVYADKIISELKNNKSGEMTGVLLIKAEIHRRLGQFSEAEKVLSEISSKKINEMYEFQFENIRRKVKLKDKGVFQYIPLQIMY